MELSIPNRVVYDFDGKASVPEVAKSIIAQDKLLRDALAVLEEVFPNLAFERPDISVREIAQQSPLRIFLVATLFAVYGEELGKDVPDVLNTLFGIDVPDEYDSVVSVIFLLVAMYGLEWLCRKIASEARDYKKVRAERRRLLENAAKRVSVPEEQLEEAIEKMLSKKKRSAMKASAEFFEPAKRLRARSVSTSGESIAEDVIQDMPSAVDLAQYEPPNEVQEISRAVVHFRAHDLDRNKAWAATIEEVYPDRRPLHLAPHVNPEQLFERTEVIADVIVTSVLDAEGDYIPSLYYLQKVHDEDVAPSPR
jgi:hypothetical protein